jgi:23S rRNA-/tRNA-specific pseudouridylate synthase
MDTDGYMVLAKNESTWEYFKDLFAQKSKKLSIPEKETVPLRKYYRAVCEITAKGVTFLDIISQKLPWYIEQVVTPNVPYTESKMGISKITSLSYTQIDDQLVVCVEMEILTGRTHQVRCHLSDNGLPIVSDVRYGAAPSKQEIQLTAYRLEFLDMYGKMKCFG